MLAIPSENLLWYFFFVLFLRTLTTKTRQQHCEPRLLAHHKCLSPVNVHIFVFLSVVGTSANVCIDDKTTPFFSPI